MAVPQWSPFISVTFTERIFMPSFMHLYIPGSLFVVAVLCITKCIRMHRKDASCWYCDSHGSFWYGLIHLYTLK